MYQTDYVQLKVMVLSSPLTKLTGKCATYKRASSKYSRIEMRKQRSHRDHQFFS